MSYSLQNALPSQKTSRLMMQNVLLRYSTLLTASPYLGKMSWPTCWNIRQDLALVLNGWNTRWASYRWECCDMS